MSGDFGLSDALGEDRRAGLARRQRDIARRYSNAEAVARLTAWLVANGYENAEQAGGGQATCADCRELVEECACTEVF